MAKRTSKRRKSHDAQTPTNNSPYSPITLLVAGYIRENEDSFEYYVPDIVPKLCIHYFPELEPWEEAELLYNVGDLTNDQIENWIKMLENKIGIMKSENQLLKYQYKKAQDRVKENKEKIIWNKQPPYLVSNVVEVLDVNDTLDLVPVLNDPELSKFQGGKCAVIKTSTKETVFLPFVGVVDPNELHPNDLVGVNKDCYLILDKLPAEYDSRVKAMEVDEKPTEDYNDVGGLDKQIEELVEAVVLPILHKERFEAIGIQPPRGMLTL